MMRASAGRLPEIDLLRGYAIAFVVCLHLGLTDPFRGPGILAVLNNTDMGLGVDLFFIISGYVISRALAGLWEVKTPAEARGWKDFPLQFYRRRFIRLWPAAALWLLLNVALAVLFAGHSLWPAWKLVAAKAVFGLVYLSDFQEIRDPSALGYFWSLAIEWQFYLLFPLLLLLLRRDSYRLAALGAVLAASVYFQPAGPAWRFLRFDGLVFGIVLYVLLHRLRLEVPHYLVFRRPPHRHAASLLLLAAIVVLPPYFPNARAGYLTANALGTVLVAMAALNRGYVSTFGLGWLVRWLGARSYSIYLVNMPVILSVLSLREIMHPSPLPHPNLWYYGVSLFCTAALAELTYRLVEMPSHRASRALERTAGADPGIRAA